MHWLLYLEARSPVFLGFIVLCVLIYLFAVMGASVGLLLFRLVSWTLPTRNDVFLILLYGLAFGFLGFHYAVALSA